MATYLQSCQLGCAGHYLVIGVHDFGPYPTDGGMEPYLKVVSVRDTSEREKERETTL